MTSNPSKITSAPIRHTLYNNAAENFGPLCRYAPDGMVICMVGPTQAGKTLLLAKILAAMREDVRDAPEGTIPIVDLQIESTQEGRAKSKWIDVQLLKILGHPIYKHMGDMDEHLHYRPWRGKDETSLRNAVKAALRARATIRLALDEAHLLTRTRNADLRGNVLESLKSMAAVDRTLILVGGYELVYKGVFDSPHFAGRSIIYDFGRYTDTPDDLSEWTRILKCYSKYLELSPCNLLIEYARPILLATSGVIGLLDKWLWACKVRASIRKQPIDADQLRSCAPSIKEQSIIANDIRQGQQALSLLSVTARAPTDAKVLAQQGAPVGSGHSDAVTQTSRSTPKKKPFERSPRRMEVGGIEIYRYD